MRDLQKRIIDYYKGVPLNVEVLETELSGYQARRNKIAALVKEGVLIRVINGVYVVNPDVSGVGIERRIVANTLYGPSYVSFETALAHYGLIPERVVEIRSAVSCRAKNYDTALGRFCYRTVPGDVFPIGIRSESTPSRDSLVEDSFLVPPSMEGPVSTSSMLLFSRCNSVE